ncbi:hypothetical protein ABZV91_12610 [Nocardia sp. NPDC004568]|uniref:hypothetical protein n=1 Tax=Nocardia sp. NPDC004568 TaxID=3154551 RepID=UPI0033AD23A5
MDAENASLGDERRGRQEEYGRAHPDSESRGFAGFGSNEFDSANGTNGATNRSDSVPDHGYTWTPAPPSTPTRNQHSAGGSAALDPFAAWNTPGIDGDAAVGVMTSGNQEPDSRFSTSPTDPAQFPAPPDDPSGPDTAALTTRHSAGSVSDPGPSDPAAMPRISQLGPGQAGEYSAALSSSARIPAPGSPYAAESAPPADPTAPTSGGRPGSDPFSVPTTQLPSSGSLEAAYPLPPETPQRPDGYGDAAADTGSLPSWLSSIGDEPVPHPLETGGRRRKLDLTESGTSAEGFNPFEDQHAPGHEENTAATVTDSHALSGAPNAEREPALDSDPPAPPQLPSRGLPTRSPRGHTAPGSGAEEESATPQLPARRLPRSAARHAPAPADEPDTVAPNAHEALPANSAILPGPAPAGDLSDAADNDRDLPAPRRLPRSAARFNTDDEQPGAHGVPQPALRLAAQPEEADPADESGAHTAPPRLAPPDGTPILDRLLDPEPAHGIDPHDESGAPVAELLTRILESEDSRHGGSDEPGEEAPDPTAAAVSPLTLVPDAAGEPAPESGEGADARPPLETRRSRRAREAAEAEAAKSAPDRTEATLSGPAPEPAPALPPTGRPAPVEDTTSRHGRSEEGADIDIHLIMRLLTASDDLEVLAGQAETGEVSAAEVARAAREARAAVLSAVTAWYGGPAQMVKFANALLQAAREN